MGANSSQSSIPQFSRSWSELEPNLMTSRSCVAPIFKNLIFDKLDREDFPIVPIFLCVANVLPSNSSIRLWSAVSAKWGPHLRFQSREGGSSLPMRPANGLSFSPVLSLCVANLPHTEHWWGKVGGDHSSTLTTQNSQCTAHHFWLENYQMLQCSFFLGFILHILRSE